MTGVAVVMWVRRQVRLMIGTTTNGLKIRIAKMPEQIDQIVSELFQRGFNPSGIAFVMGLLAEQHAEGSLQRAAFMHARQEFLER